MKTALLHYWLTNMRGGEKVLAALGEVFPDADIFTHAYIPGKVPVFNKFRVTESFVSKLPFGRKHPQVYLPLLPSASRRFKFDEYDLIVSSESGPIKGIRKPRNARHVCYCHTPMRYVWDMYDEYYENAGVFGKTAMRLFTPFMRKEDLKSVESVDEFIANSKFVAERIKRIYKRDSIVVHPPVDIEFFNQKGVLPSCIKMRPQSYYLYAGELCSYKRPDLVVEACLKMNRKLVVVGNGKLREKLLSHVRGCENIFFLGRISDDELRGVYANAKALIFPGVEDFGIVPVEAQAAGTPVIAFRKGGALETVHERETGIFFDQPTIESLCEGIETFESIEWNPERCKMNALKFSHQEFISKVSSVLLKQKINAALF
jgi:glycosyltransferase involved in cell wall biosynthesis